jgi:hypothetical protein
MSQEVMEELRNEARAYYEQRGKGVVKALAVLGDATREELNHFGVDDADDKETVLFGIIASELDRQGFREEASMLASRMVGIYRATLENL